MKVDGRDVCSAACSCGGKVVDDLPTDVEEKKYGCQIKGCCSSAMKCSKCGIRFSFSLAAPEYNRRD